MTLLCAVKQVDTQADTQADTHTTRKADGFQCISKKNYAKSVDPRLRQKESIRRGQGEHPRRVSRLTRSTDLA